MLSLRDAAFAVENTRPVSLLQTLSRFYWTPLPRTADGKLSVRGLMQRYCPVGIKLRALANGTKDQWKHIDRTHLVPQLRARLRDPAIINQNRTGLCGSLPIVVELARRRPLEYVRAVTELLETGKFTTIGGMIIKADQQMRDEPIISGSLDEADWILAATMRDDANLSDNVDDDALGPESITMWSAMSDWTQHVLGLKGDWEVCFNSGELDAIREAQKAIDAGGVAFLMVDSYLLQDGDQDGHSEENMWWSRRRHDADKGFQAATDKKIHSMDDSSPDHWVLFLGGLKLDSDSGPIELKVWSYAAEYEVTGDADAFGEYLYAVVTGRPK